MYTRILPKPIIYSDLEGVWFRMVSLYFDFSYSLLIIDIQASSDMITEVMKDVVSAQKNDDGFLEQAKILVISHDICFTSSYIYSLYLVTSISEMFMSGKIHKVVKV